MHMVKRRMEPPPNDSVAGVSSQNELVPCQLVKVDEDLRNRGIELRFILDGNVFDVH